MSKYVFRFNTLNENCNSIHTIFVTDYKGNILCKDESLLQSRDIKSIQIFDRRILNYENVEQSTIKNDMIIVREEKWELKQTRENNYFVKEQEFPNRYIYDVEYPELGNWKLQNKAKFIEFDGSKFVDSDLNVRGFITLYSNTKKIFRTYCDLERVLHHDYLIFSYLIAILYKYAEYSLNKKN